MKHNGPFNFQSFDTAEEFQKFIDERSKQIQERKPTPLEAYAENIRPVITSAIEYMKIAFDVDPKTADFKHPEEKRNDAADQLVRLGKSLNAAGGFALMRSMFTAIENVQPDLVYRYGCAMRCLEVTWDGIGEWQG